MLCDYCGCIYNEDGYCNYENAAMKISYYRVCDQEDLDFVHADLYGY